MNDLTINVDGTTVTVPASALRDHLADHDWIPIDEAPDHCGHDLDAAHEAGAASVRSEHIPSALVMEQWHNDHHDGTVQFCYQQPCRDLREAAGV